MLTMTGRILVVDENENLRKTMERVLRRKGHDVITTGSCDEAIQIAVTQPSIDLVLLDIKLPLQSIVEIHQQLKESIQNGIVIMMTAFAVEDLIHDSLLDSSYAIIRKPFDIENIQGLIIEAQNTKEGALVLVSDTNDMISSYKGILEQKGFSVTLARNSEEALELAKSDSLDILFLDIKQSTINGLVTYASIKEIRPDAIVVLSFSSPIDVNEIVEEAMSVSSFSCLHKPLDMVQVFAIVEGILSKKGGIE